jgi:N-acetylglucosaminyl-diphospho-decaprenol L-rhamnosyltransferase
MASDDIDPRIGIVTVAYRSNQVLPLFLRSVRDSSVSGLATVIVDNWPGDGSGARELANEAGASYVPLPGNPGYGGAVNAGVATLSASVEWVLVVNPDVVLAPGAVDALMSVAETDAAIGSLGPTILNSDGTVYPSARAVPSLKTGVGHALFVNLWQTNPWTRRYRQESEVGGERRDTGWLSGACVLVRRTAFDAIGGFDDGYFMYFEDVDLGYRLGKAGYRNVYAPSAVVTHTGAHSTTKDSAQMVRAHHASARRFLSKKYPGWRLWPVRSGLSVGLAVRSALVRRHAE